jgi:hypothetical protein
MFYLDAVKNEKNSSLGRMVKNMPSVFDSYILQDSLCELNAVRSNQGRILNKLLASKGRGEKIILNNEEHSSISKLLLLNSSALALMLEAKATGPSRTKRRSQTRSDDYQPFLLYNEEAMHNFVKAIREHIHNGDSFHYDFLVKDESTLHWTPIQMIYDASAGKANIYVVDSAGENPNYPYISLLNSLFPKEMVKLHFWGGNIQKSASGCWAFGIKQLNKLSNMTLEEKAMIPVLESSSNDLICSDMVSLSEGKAIYDGLPPQLLEGVQTVVGLNNYLERRISRQAEGGRLTDFIVDKKGRKNLLDTESDAYKFFVTYQYQVAENDNESSVVLKDANRNLSMINAAIKYNQKALDKYDELYKCGGPQFVQDILERRSSFEGMNTYGKHPEESLYKYSSMIQQQQKQLTHYK